MNEETSNDNHVALAQQSLPEPDAHGQAAMLLSESMLHSLVAGSVISVADAIEIVDVAAEVKEEIAPALGDSVETMEKSLAMLGAIRISLTNDLPIGPISVSAPAPGPLAAE